MGERFVFVKEEEINLPVDKPVPENTKKSTSYAVIVFDGKLFINRSRVLREALKDHKHSSLHLTLKICSDVCPGTLICSASKFTVFLELRSLKTVCFSEQLMSTDKSILVYFRPKLRLLFIY